METVRMMLPKAAEGQEQEVFVGVNGVGYRIRRGVEVLVPQAVAEVLHNSDRAAEENDAFLRANWDKE